MTRTVLYIEDHYHNRRLVQKILSAHGYTVLLAEDGETGWEIIQQHHPDLVLLDIALPGAMDGLDVVSRVRAEPELRNTWIVALTASAMIGDRERFLAQGCDDYIAKPIRARDLLDKIQICFDR